MTETKRTIDRETYLKALALFTLASSHQRRCDELEKEMNKVLGLEHPNYTGSRVSDEIYHYDGGNFDQALEYVDIVVDMTPPLPNGERGGAA